MTRTLASLGLLALLLALAPFAAAQDGDKAPPEEVMGTDCPPDMMCATAEGNETEEQGEFVPNRPEECENCRGDAPADTCMDGQQVGEACDDVMYFGDGPANSGPNDESPALDDAPRQGAAPDAKTVPGAQVLAVLAAFVGAIALLSRRD